MSSIAQRLLTAEEFGELPENGARRELVRGEVPDVLPGFSCAVAELFA